MSGTTGVGDGELVWGGGTVGLVANIVHAIISSRFYSIRCPDGSSHFVFVVGAAIHGVGFGGVSFVAVVGE